MSRIDVLQATAWYPPFDLGGTEIYLEGLVAGLTASGITSGVLVPRHENAPEVYSHHGVAVETYPVNRAPAPGEIELRRPHADFEMFRQRLRAHPRAIYHQHSWTRGCGAPHLKAARDAGMRTVITVHVPGNVCLRGTMLLNGRGPCDGRNDDQRCGACWAEAQGASPLLARGLAHLPLTLANRMRTQPSRLATALSARALAADHKSSLREMIANADCVVAVCQWLFDALLLNGAPREKLVLSRQGVAMGFQSRTRTTERSTTDRAPLRLLYLGRLSRVKGVDVTARAVVALPRSVNVRLTIHGIPVAGEEDYAAEIAALAAMDPRIEVRAPVARNLLPDVMAEHNVLVVPSQWMETGPLVVLEAQAMGLFVLGSRLGGITELVDEPDGGMLVEPASAEAWRQAVDVLVSIHHTSGLQVRRRAVRTMNDAASEMAELYATLSN